MTPLHGFTPLASGKVRDLYVPQQDDGLLLLVASDRVSAFDAVLEPAIPGKGSMLTTLSRWWFERLPDVPNHLASEGPAVPESVRERAMLVRRLSMHPVECVVRGIVTGSGFAEYRETGAISGVRLPTGLLDGDRLPEPIFTPAFKAEQGEHDENIPFDRVVELVGGETAELLRARSLAVYSTAAAIAADAGLLLADTKFEFGSDEEDDAVLADEVLTSDSSRYWDAAEYDAGRRGLSFDKQIVRDWLRARWDRSGPPPRLPDDVVERTAARYRELLARRDRRAVTAVSDRLADATAMGAVTLDVADLDGMVRYYGEGVGLDVQDVATDAVTLGRGGVASVVLRAAPHLRRAPSEGAGLFHTAILFETRAPLAAAVLSVATRYPDSFTGSSDHLVSEAFYFDDPEGNGVELYFDRPRSEWRWNGDQVSMATLPLDPNRFLTEHLTEAAGAGVAPAAGTLGAAQVGHVHLKVGDIPTARAFYVDVLGFSVTAAFGGQALFVSAGGYHHHVGMNTWSSRGAGPRTPALGLGQVSLLLPDADTLGSLQDRLITAGVAVRYDGRALAFEDPWRNLVLAAAPGDAPGPR